MADNSFNNPFTELSAETLRARRSMKWRRYGPDVLPLWIAEMDAALAEPIQTALIDAVRRGDTGYADPGRLSEAFAGYARRAWGWSPDAAQMVVVPDAVRGIGAVLTTVTAPGDGVVINTPTYPPFPGVIESAGRTVVRSPLRRSADGSFQLDLDALDRDLAGAGVTAYVLCNPHNPSGLVCTRDELLAVTELAQRHRVRLLVDEIHAPLVYAPRAHIPLATLDAEAAAEAIVFTSASKAWNLAGLKASLVVAASDAAWSPLQALPVEVTFGTGLFGVLAGEAAFDHGDEWLARVLAALDYNRGLLASLLAQSLPTVGYHPPQATYLAWLDLRRLGLGDDPAEQLLERGKVALANGPAFGELGLGHARLNFATSPELLTEAIRRMAAVADGGI